MTVAWGGLGCMWERPLAMIVGAGRLVAAPVFAEAELALECR